MQCVCGYQIAWYCITMHFGAACLEKVVLASNGMGCQNRMEMCVNWPLALLLRLSIECRGPLKLAMHCVNVGQSGTNLLYDSVNHLLPDILGKSNDQAQPLLTLQFENAPCLAVMQTLFLQYLETLTWIMYAGKEFCLC